jgi:hypothetical protein
MDDIAFMFRNELSSGERLLWYGRPKLGLVLRPTDAFMIPFSLLWGGFAIFWEASVVSITAPSFFSLWGVPFVLIGLYMIIGRFFVDAYIRSKTFYAVTSERILIVSGMLNREVRSLSLKTLSDMNLKLKGNGSGTILFGNTTFGAAFYDGTPMPGSRRYQPPAFEMIEDARAVYELVRKAQKELG